jgi:hypothetical protein
LLASSFCKFLLLLVTMQHDRLLPLLFDSVGFGEWLTERCLASCSATSAALCSPSSGGNSIVTGPSASDFSIGVTICGLSASLSAINLSVRLAPSLRLVYRWAAACCDIP